MKPIIFDIEDIKNNSDGFSYYILGRSYDLEENEIKCIKNFLNQDLLKNILNAQIYKEYEFIYDSDNVNYHGIIDLMLVYDEYIDIIDYKLMNTTNDEYIKQLNGYKEYIEKTFGKNVNLYLYSIINNEIVKL